MPRGKSGRVVIEITPELKKRLYSELALSDLSLKTWFISQVTAWLHQKTQITNSEDSHA